MMGLMGCWAAEEAAAKEAAIRGVEVPTVEGRKGG